MALNFAQRLSGVATLTARFVEAVAGSRARAFWIRARPHRAGGRLEKYAVACGGGDNHRFGLFDRIFIKDNHLAALRRRTAQRHRGRGAAGARAVSTTGGGGRGRHSGTGRAGLRAGADVILLDNMSNEDLRAAVRLIDGRAKTEASGGVTLATVRAIAETGVDFISVGALTHSAPAVDIALDIQT